MNCGQCLQQWLGMVDNSLESQVCWILPHYLIDNFLKNSLLSNYFTTFSIIFALEVIYVSCVHGWFHGHGA